MSIWSPSSWIFQIGSWPMIEAISFEKWRARVVELSKNKKSIRAVAALFVATVLGAGVNFGVQVILARALGVEQFGAFSSALAMVTLVAPLAGFGLAGYWLSVYGREGGGARRWLPSSFRFLLISISLVIIAVLAWAWLGPHDGVTSTLLAILSVQVLGQTAFELANAKYQLEGRSIRLALWQTLPHLLRFIGVGVVVLLWGNAVEALHAAIVFALTAAVVVLLGGYQVGQMVMGVLCLEGHKVVRSAQTHGVRSAGIQGVISGAWPFGLAGLFYLIYFQSDIILIRYMIGEADAGIYNVAFVVMAAVYLFPAVLYQKFLLPKLHRWAYHEPSKLHDVYRTGAVVMLALGIFAMTLLWLLAPTVLPWLFGDAYGSAVELLIILAIAAPFRFLASAAGALLTTGAHMRLKVRLMSWAALLNVLLNIAFIPMLGATGAAISTVITEFVLLLLLIGNVNRVIKPAIS